MARNRLKKIVRLGVLTYSIYNRRRKAERISTWMAERDCSTVMFTGTVSLEDSDENTGIVERRVAEGREVKVGFNVIPCKTQEPFVIADARRMPFPDKFVDFALANAVVEHVGGEEDQRRFVHEHSRVARCWVITTPNKWFPVESHTSTVFLHWIPRWRNQQHAHFSRLLSKREFASLLPTDAEIEGWPWSPTFTAYYTAQG